MNASEMTAAQLNALKRKYESNPDGSTDFHEFLTRCNKEICGPAIMIEWCGMWVGVEPDGYMHT